MLIQTENVLARAKAGLQAEFVRQRELDWVQDQLRYAKYVTGDVLDPTVLEARAGRKMNTGYFETLLARAVPNLLFEFHPKDRSKKILYHLRGGKKHSICPYESEWMPEYSLMQRRIEEVPDFSVGRTKANPLSRADLPAHEWDPEKGWVFDPTVAKPGMKRVEGLGREIMRGWRTVLARLVESKITTPAVVETAFNEGSTPEWAAIMGRRDKSLRRW